MGMRLSNHLPSRSSHQRKRALESPRDQAPQGSPSVFWGTANNACLDLPRFIWLGVNPTRRSSFRNGSTLQHVPPPQLPIPPRRIYFQNLHGDGGVRAHDHRPEGCSASSISCLVLSLPRRQKRRVCRQLKHWLDTVKSDNDMPLQGQVAHLALIGLELIKP